MNASPRSAASGPAAHAAFLQIRATFCYTAKARPTTNARGRDRVIDSANPSIVTRDILHPCLFRICLFLFFLASAVHAEEGMWLFNAPPTAQIKNKYGYELTPAWL